MKRRSRFRPFADSLSMILKPGARARRVDQRGRYLGTPGEREVDMTPG